MGVFVRAVVTGFGFSLGAALYKKAAKKLGLDEPAGDKNDKAAEAVGPIAANPPKAGPAARLEPILRYLRGQ
jgi:hypothetical protein